MSKSEQAEVPAGVPMQKTKPATLIAGVVGVLVIGGLAVFSLSGSSSESKPVATEAENVDGTSKLDAKERKAHLETTQKALAAAAAAEAQEKAVADVAAAEAAAKEQAEEEASSAAAAPAAPAKKPVSQKTAKKKIDSLDALGADITGALK